MRAMPAVVRSEWRDACSSEHAPKLRMSGPTSNAAAATVLRAFCEFMAALHEDREPVFDDLPAIEAIRWDGYA